MTATPAPVVEAPAPVVEYNQPAPHVSDCNRDDDRDSVDMNRVGIPDVSTSIGGFLHKENGG